MRVNNCTVLYDCMHHQSTMSDLLDILKALSQHTILKAISPSQLLIFLTQASALKRHIVLAQPAGEPTDSAPQILPPLVREFLAKGTGIALHAVQDAWDILRHHAWAMSPLADCVTKEQDTFRQFVWSQGFSKHLFLGQGSG